MSDSPGATCRFCDKVFNNISNCRRHVRAVHKVDEDGNPVDQVATCSICDKSFTHKRNLKRHLQTIHSLQNSEFFKCFECKFSTRYKNNLEKHVEKKHRSKQLYSCSLCDAKYLTKKYLKLHKNKVHSNKQPRKIKRKCPICNHVSNTRTKEEMYLHLQKKHEVKLQWEELSFSSESDFFKWKSEMEALNSSSFIQSQGHSKRIQHYKCHRSGDYRKQGRNIRHLKIMKSCKINAFCPATMKVTVKSENEINVLFLNTHVGHKNELKYKRLTEAERRAIANQLALKMPHDEILKGVRNSLTNCELQRIHLLNKKDIHNIEQSFNLGNEAIKHPFDPVSVLMWVESLKNSPNTSFVYYKPQGCIEDSMKLEMNDFVLIFMTKAQEEMINKFGKDIICIDGTHGTNSYDFQLFTLLVMDETKEGFPVAFMISNKSDEKTLSFFMEKIRENIGQIQPAVFMSDMDETLYSSWAKHMGPTKQLYCSWHVLKAWKKNIRSKIKNKDKQDECFKVLKALLYELDEYTFTEALGKALTKMRLDNETEDFYLYFDYHYVQKECFKKWAYSYRQQCGINTNMHMENFHRLLKYCYLKGKKTKRLDKTICALLSLLKDKLFDLIIKHYKGKVVKKLQILRKRHAESLNFEEANMVKESETKFSVLSSKCTDIYTVRKIKVCTSCFLRCDHCKSCFHEYTCNCMDSAIRNNMCKHIHLVAKTNPLVQTEAGNPTLGKDEDNVQDTNYIVNELSSQDLVDDRSLKSSIANFTSDLVRTIEDNVQTEEEFKFLKRYMAGFLPSLQALKSTEPSKLNVVDKAPANANIIKQKRFISTKKKHKAQKEPDNHDKTLLELLKSSP